MEKIPRVGMGIIVKKGEQVLFLKRKGAHGEGTWSVPGGHLEFCETLEEGATREVLEETGVKITDVKFLTITNDIFESEGKHYITLWMTGKWAEGEPQICEPDKCPEVKWISPNNLPNPLFLPLQNLIQRGFKISS